MGTRWLAVNNAIHTAIAPATSVAQKGSSNVASSPPGDQIQKLCDQQQLDKALDILLRLDQQSTVPTQSVYSSLLKACAKRKALASAKEVHAHLAKRGLESTRFLGESVVITLVKCGGMDDALEVFHRLPHRTVFSWTAMIDGYNTAGQAQEALRMYKQMREEGLKPDKYTFVSLIRSCISLSDLEEGKRIHSEALKQKCGSDLFVGTSLVDMYGKCGSIQDAKKVFDALSQRNVVSWTAMIAAYVQQGQGENALQLYEDMQREGVSPNDRTFVSLFQACAMLAEREDAVDGKSTKLKSLEKGRAIHADARKMGYDSDIFVGSSLVSMYGKCSSIVDAQEAFDGLSRRDAVSWNALLAAYAEQRHEEKAMQLFENMLEQGESPDARTFMTVLQACATLAEKEDVAEDGQSNKVKLLQMGKALHGEAWRKGYTADVFVSNTLISMYGKCGSIMDAQSVFGELFNRDVVSWTVMLAAYVQQGEAEMALQLYLQMKQEGIVANDRALVSTLQSCGMLAEKEEDFVLDGQCTKVKSLIQGKAIHADARDKGYDSDPFVGSTLVSMYGKCGSIVDAQNVFDGLSQRDLVAWSAMLTAYAQQGKAEKALQLYEQMQENGVSPDAHTFVSVLQACSVLADNEEVAFMDRRRIKLKSLEMGRAIHACARRKGYDAQVFVSNTLISLYGKCASIADSKHAFDYLSRRDVVSWNVMLAAYVEQGQAEKALQLYEEMQQEGTSPDEVTLACIFQACSSLGSLPILTRTYERVISSGKDLSPLLASTAIHAYGRCARMVDAQSVFDSLPHPDVVSWTALIAGYAREGDCMASLRCYEKMQLAGVRPNTVTFLSLVAACSHAGLVDRGLEYFESMSRDHGIAPQIEHYVSMVDLLGRAGCFLGVEELLNTMPMQPDLAMWLCLLGSCRKHGWLLLAEQAFERAVHLQSKHPAAYVLMSNIYADAGLSDRAKEVDELRQKQGAWKDPGHSWIEYMQQMHTFLVGGHQQGSSLHDFVTVVSGLLKGKGVQSGDSKETAL